MKVAALECLAFPRQYRKESPCILQKHFACKTLLRDKCGRKKVETGGELEVRMEDGEREYELIWIKWMRIRSIYLELV